MVAEVLVSLVLVGSRGGFQAWCFRVGVGLLSFRDCGVGSVPIEIVGCWG